MPPFEIESLQSLKQWEGYAFPATEWFTVKQVKAEGVPRDAVAQASAIPNRLICASKPRSSPSLDAVQNGGYLRATN